MILDKLALINFKNFESFELDPAKKFNCFIGANGVGKTNLLDAIYYLSFSKSFLQGNDKQHIKHNEDFFMLNGKFSHNEQSEEIACTVKHGQTKIFKRNGKEYDKLSQHIGLIPLVYTAPLDINIVQNGSDIRRRFIDTVISQFNKDYLRNIISYQRALEQRNQLLKQFNGRTQNDESALEIWDMQLATYGNEIFKHRMAFATDITPIFNKYYQNISQQREKLSLNYKSQLMLDSIENLLLKTRSKDIMMQYTSTGIHKDDLEFMLGDNLLRKFGSQGQQKTFVLALKLAQFEYIQQKTQRKPILLLDDIFDKLDASRVEAIIKIVSNDDFGQVFITDTNYERTANLLEKTSGQSKLITLGNNTN
jgi:DNA replication and repair protein RecF